MQFLFFYENMFGKPLEFDRMHEKKYFFLKEETNLIFFFENFWFFLKKSFRESHIFFNTESISYNVSLQPI